MDELMRCDSKFSKQIKTLLVGNSTRGNREEGRERKERKMINKILKNEKLLKNQTHTLATRIDPSFTPLPCNVDTH